MSEIKFSDGISKREEKDRIVYPEELLDKKCGGCVRCQKRDNDFSFRTRHIKRKDTAKSDGYHCSMQPYDKDITPEDKACIWWWDKEEKERKDRQHEEDIENRRKELWAIYAEKEPIKLPIVHDGYGMIPMCPICGEPPYSTEQCHWCGQRFIQEDKELEEYTKPITKQGKCFNCGADVTVHISKYNGHKSFRCEKCGCSMME